MKPIIYVAHPVSGDVKANCDKVLGWLKWLTRIDPSRIYIAPWVGEVLAHLDMDPIPADFYDRVLSDDEDVVRRLDGVLLTGVGRGAPNRRDNGMLKSSGMTREVAANAMAGGLLFDLSEYATWEAANGAFESHWATYDQDGVLYGGNHFMDDYLVRPKFNVQP